MKVFYSDSRDSIVVGAAKLVFPPKSLRADLLGDQITIWPPDDTFAVVSVSFDRILDVNGAGFADGPAALAYLQAEFDKASIENPADISEAIAALDAAIQ